VQRDFDFIAELQQGCKALDLPELDNETFDRLYIYFKELKRWSKKINLIARKATDNDILEKHFLDSLTLLPLLTGDQAHLLDIGTGAGFPGLVCKAAKPELELTLVEPRQKRVAFLSHITRTLELKNVFILDCRVEDEARLVSDGSFTHITSRAVNEVRLFLDMSSRFMKNGVQVICMKGPKWQEELSIWEQNQNFRQYTMRFHKEYRLPQSQVERHLLVFEQI
jgi:16S rRNA (guanine527-N7)-methyltransferase